MDTLEVATVPQTKPMSNEGNYSANTIDLSNLSDMPELDGLEVQNVDLTVEYWTPEKEGESVYACFSHIEMRKVSDEDTGEEEVLPTAIFYKKVNGDVVRFANASKRLVGVFENGNIPSGFLCKITYMGKKKNATNTFQSDTWKVNPLKKK